MTELEIRELREIPELQEICRLFDLIWGFEPGALDILCEIMRGYAYQGHYVFGAYLDGGLVGASVATFSPPGSYELNSFVTGALAGVGAGLALKRHQRLWALERGIERITWTFDPLVRRNAHFNLGKLGARAERYLENHYGRMADAVNGEDESDRILAVWHLEAPEVVTAAGTGRVLFDTPPDAEPLLIDRDGYPELRGSEAPTVLIQVPADIEALRCEDPSRARVWRKEVRETLGQLFEEGGVVLGFHNKSSYVVCRNH